MDNSSQLPEEIEGLLEFPQEADEEEEDDDEGDFPFVLSECELIGYAC